MRRTPIPFKNRHVMQYPLKTGETFASGSAVLLDANEDIAECGADPSTVLGFAVHDADDGGDRVVDSDKQLVAIAGPGRTFLMEGDNDPTEDDINQSYGIAKDADGIWYVDGTDTVNLVVQVVDVDTDRNLYEVLVLTSVQQIPA